MGNVAILSAEMATLTRQHAACEFLLAAAEERLQGNFGSDEEHAKLYTQLLQLATTVDTETRKIWQVCSRGKQCTSGCQVHADAGTLDQFLSAQATVSTCTPSGSAAVNFARAAHARAQLLDRQVTTLLAERKQLQTELNCSQLCGAMLRPSFRLCLRNCACVEVPLQSRFRSIIVIYMVLSSCPITAALESVQQERVLMGSSKLAATLWRRVRTANCETKLSCSPKSLQCSPKSEMCS
jgi:hypothetical protein